MAKAPAPQEQIRATLKHVEEELAGAFDEFAQPLVDDPSQLAPLIQTFFVRIFDVFANRYQAFVRDDEQLRSFYIPTLDRLSKKMIEKAKQWTASERAGGIWSATAKTSLLENLRARLIVRTQHWKSEAMKRLRETQADAASPKVSADITSGECPHDGLRPTKPSAALKAHRHTILKDCVRSKKLNDIQGLAWHLGTTRSALYGMVRGDRSRYSEEKLNTVLKKVGCSKATWDEVPQTPGPARPK